MIGVKELDELGYAKISGLISVPLKVEFEEECLHMHYGQLYAAFPSGAIVRDRLAWLQVIEIVNSILQEADSANLHSGSKE